MNGKAEVLYNGIVAGYLISEEDEYVFYYDEKYLNNPDMPAVSLSFPKSKKEFHSEKLFPFFFGLLTEGDQKQIQCRTLGIDEADHFKRLIKTAQNTIGAVSVMEAVNE
jgi:serine/threonine-protein kinase HipA